MHTISQKTVATRLIPNQKLRNPRSLALSQALISTPNASQDRSSDMTRRYERPNHDLPMAQASIDIQAPISVVFAILLHFAAYPDWNPFIVKVTVITPNPSLHPIATNTEFTLHCKYSDGTTSTSRERVKKVTPPDGDNDVGAGGVRKALLAYRFTGPLAAAGVVESTRFQWLEQCGDADAGVTRYRTEAVFRGTGAGLVPVAQVQDGFERMADALKARAESIP